MSSNSSIPIGPVSNEADLFALFQAIWQQKRIILAVSVLCGLTAMGYAHFATPEYQVSSVLRPAAINELDALNRSGVYTLPPSEALLKVGLSLESYETRLSFFRANQELFTQFKRPGRTLEQSFEDFNRSSLKLILPDPKKVATLNDSIGLELNYPKGVDGVRILNGFVDYAITVEREKIAADLKAIVSNRLTELKGKIALTPLRVGRLPILLYGQIASSWIETESKPCLFCTSLTMAPLAAPQIRIINC